MTAAQKPLGTLFGPFTTTEEVARDVDLTGKTAIVTGGASNLGHETVRVLASKGAHVIVPARDVEGARQSLPDIPRVQVVALDLLDPHSIRGFAEEFLATHSSLDLLVLSAGVMATPLFRDGEDHEGQFATNHLGHFRLTAALWPALCAAGGSRVVVLSSRGHQLGEFDLGDLDFVRRPYDKWLAYGRTIGSISILPILMPVILMQRFQHLDSGLRFAVVHAGDQTATNRATNEPLAAFPINPNLRGDFPSVITVYA